MLDGILGLRYVTVETQVVVTERHWLTFGEVEEERRDIEYGVIDELANKRRLMVFCSEVLHV